MKFVFVAGIPASGKSTYCEGRDAAVFSFDVWLTSHYGETDVEKAGWMFITDPQGLDKYLNAVARAWRCITDFDFYLDDGAVDRKRRKAIIAGLKKRGIEHIDCVYLLCPMYEAAERNIAREWPISRDNFYQACTRQEYPTEDEGFDSVKFVVTGGESENYGRYSR